MDSIQVPSVADRINAFMAEQPIGEFVPEDEISDNADVSLLAVRAKLEYRTHEGPSALRYDVVVANRLGVVGLVRIISKERYPRIKIARTAGSSVGWYGRMIWQVRVVDWSGHCGRVVFESIWFKNACEHAIWMLTPREARHRLVRTLRQR